MNEYPTYKRGELETIYSKFLKSERKVIEDFIDYCKIGAQQRKLNDIRRSITQFRHIIKTKFDNITLKTIRDYLVTLNKSDRTKYTTNGIKTHIKRFLKWYFPDWSKRFSNLDDIKTQKGFNYKKVNEGTLLKEEDIEKLLSGEPRLIYKTLLMVLWETGMRPSEALSITWKAVHFNVEGELSRIDIYATKNELARSVYVQKATAYLQNVREHITDSTYVFPSPRNRNTPLSLAMVTKWFKDLTKKELGKNCFLYLLRHSRATQLYLHNPKVASRFLGHRRDMGDLYTHLSSKDIKESLLKTVYKIEKEITKEQQNKYEKRIAILEKHMKAQEKAFKYWVKSGLEREDTLYKLLIAIQNEIPKNILDLKKVKTLSSSNKKNYSEFVKILTQKPSNG